MDFNDTPEEAAFRAEARAWLEANAERRPPEETVRSVLSAERLEGDIVGEAKKWQAKKCDAGWACITWPEEYGGRGGSAIQSVIWRQEESKFRTPPDIFGIGIGMAGPTIMAHGRPDQKDRYLPKLARGDEIWCQLFSEPSAGSDLAGLRSTAVREGDDWIVNGQKIWTTGAQYCDYGILVVRSDPNVAKHAGLTYFIVDMKAPGVEIRPIRQINEGTGFNEVFFNDVRIPDANRLGEVGDGWRVAITTLMNERSSIGGGGGGGAFRDLFRLAQQASGDGEGIADASVRQRLADFYVRSKGLQYTSYRTLTALSRGTIPGPEASLGKLAGAVLQQEMAALGLELQGAAGGTSDESFTAQEGTWQDLYLAIPGLRIAGGTDEVLRNIIAERVLRLPPEPRMDKDVAFRDIPSGPPSK